MASHFAASLSASSVALAASVAACSAASAVVVTATDSFVAVAAVEPLPYAQPSSGAFLLAAAAAGLGAVA